MDNMRHSDTEILEQIRRIKPGICPDFYLRGHSTYVLEALGLKITKEIETRKLIMFKGIVQHFSIYLPYFDSENGASKFMDHLRESVSVARDCYDSYQGIVLLECSEEWSAYGFNPKLNVVLNYIKAQTGICFIVLAPEKKNSKYGNTFFAEFTRCKIWMKIEIRTLDVSHYISLFQDLAWEHGFKVPEPVAQKFADHLKKRKETDLDNESAIEQMIKQIRFNRYLTGSKKQEIDMEDLMYISGVDNCDNERTIGFASGSR